jgi:Na+/H+ antiporter NhaD/arsenite permease-like protein
MVHLSPTTVLDVQTLAAYVIFLASYLVFALGKFPGLKIDRAGAAIIGAVGMVAFRIAHPADALSFIDFPTLVLLFSMMLIVGNLHLVGFFEWTAEIVLRRLKPSHLLPAVVFTSGVLSAFFVNDIVCLVMVPFVLNITRRLRLESLPYLLAVATASNIGSVASITGNPQNMLIGSFSGIAYRDFLRHLGPVAVVGLFLDWMVLHWMQMRKVKHAGLVDDGIPLPPLDLSRLTKPAIVVTAVVIAFFVGVPPAMAAALGAAVLLITRTLEPRKLYEEVDWGLLVFFVGLFLIVGGAQNAGIIGKFLRIADHWTPLRSERCVASIGLISCLADVQTGVGPFLAIYLAGYKWNEERVGLALTVGGIAGILTQTPAGALVDFLRSKRALVAAAVAALAAGALLIALFPSFWPVMGAQVLIGGTSSVFLPAICAMSLGIVGRAAFDFRQGRNQTFNSAGNVIAAVSMGLLGYFVSNRSIFFFVRLSRSPRFCPASHQTRRD